MKKICFIFSVAFCSLPGVAFAQTSARDADIDLKMNATALSGILPPTGFQKSGTPTSAGALKFDPYALAAIKSGKVIAGQKDGKARAYEVRGKVTLIKRGSPIEKKLKKGDVLEVGDILITEAGSAVSVTFDESYTNAIHITESSKAILESIEPTNIRIENGSVFSSVNGLAKDSSWKVTTPSAVAAVRGTLYIVRYLALNGQFYAATVDVPNDGKNSAIDIQAISGNGNANVPEGKEILLEAGQSPSDSLVKDLDPVTLAEILRFFENLADQQQTGENIAPPTGGSGDSFGGGENDQGDGANPDQDPGDSIQPDDQPATPNEPLALIEDDKDPPKEDPKENDDEDRHNHGGHHDDDNRNDNDRDDDRWNDNNHERDNEHGDDNRGSGDDRDNDRENDSHDDDRWNDNNHGRDNEHDGDNRGRGNDHDDDRKNNDRDSDRGDDDRGRGNDRDNDRGHNDDNERGHDRDDDRGRGNSRDD